MKWFLGLVLFFSVFQANAKTELASLIQDHMVLQRNREVSLWGTDDPGKHITVKAGWGADASAVADAHGNWALKLKTEDAGGPYEISINGSDSIHIQDVLLGEVWICSGQSNMEMPVEGFNGQPVYGSNEVILQSANDRIRLFQVKNTTAAKPLTRCLGIWKKAEPASVASFSAAGYFFAKRIEEILQVPVGVIESAWGGTVAEAWTPEATLKSGFPECYDGSIIYANEQNTPARLYNAMIHPLVPYTIQGAIWYQGEANKDRPEQYARLFPSMIESWRAVWSQGDFPFYFVQIAPFIYWNKDSWHLREAQLKTMQTVPNTGMAVTLDIGTELIIHPPYKKEVGDRLAYWALAKTYGMKGFQYCGPVYQSMEVKDGKATLQFDCAPQGITDLGRGFRDFEIAGADQVFYPAEVKNLKGRLQVWSPEVPAPVAVRYGWKNFLEGSLFNTAGLPASSFRTDDWD